MDFRPEAPRSVRTASKSPNWEIINNVNDYILMGWLLYDYDSAGPPRLDCLFFPIVKMSSLYKSCCLFLDLESTRSSRAIYRLNEYTVTSC